MFVCFVCDVMCDVVESVLCVCSYVCVFFDVFVWSGCDYCVIMYGFV